MCGERLMVSSRFHAAVKSAIFRIERNAFQDEDNLALLVSDDHRRRQRLLIEKQIDKAFQLRDLYESLESPGIGDRMDEPGGDVCRGRDRSPV